MGYMRHNAIVVVAAGYRLDKSHYLDAPDIDEFRTSLPEEWQSLIIGPIRSVINDYVTFVFAADGSKEGWAHSNAGDEYRARFLDLFRFAHEDGSSPFEVLVMDARFGGDEPWSNDEDELIVSTNFRAAGVRLDPTVAGSSDA
jgi:hypothetical protein